MKTRSSEPTYRYTSVRVAAKLRVAFREGVVSPGVSQNWQKQTMERQPDPPQDRWHHQGHGLHSQETNTRIEQRSTNRSSQQNVSSDQLLTVGIKKDISCLPEIPMLVLNNEGAPSDSPQQNVTSDQLLTVGITKDMDCIHQIPIPELNNEAPSDPSQQNVSPYQLLTVGITKDMDCIQEIPMLALNNEAPSDPSRRMSSLTNFSLVSVFGITKNMDRIQEIPIHTLYQN
ncbi:uncharacterized protein [Diadema antillarum]|uniref:uncharacterized protein n=1 Tax=Diadema antillarum TaxID=105358 RepID=UPI003A86ECD4